MRRSGAPTTSRLSDGRRPGDDAERHLDDQEHDGDRRGELRADVEDQAEHPHDAADERLVQAARADRDVLVRPDQRADERVMGVGRDQGQRA